MTRALALSALLLLTACGPSIFQRQMHACTTSACVQDVQMRQARYRAMMLNDPWPVAQPVYIPPVNYAPSPVYSVAPPSGTAPSALQTVAPAPYQPQTWGQTPCAPAIAPVAWDTPVTERNALIPAGC